MTKNTIFTATALVVAVTSFGLVGSSLTAVYGHDKHVTFSAGQPGNPKKPARIVLITMRESDGKMLYNPDKILVRKGEQIRFILENNGMNAHEFLLATTEENLKHAELMKRYPDMEHDDPNGKRLKPNEKSEIVWRFTKVGEFEFACLIPGHRESRMFGKIFVK
jgi:uncharacterized cupredoxin-like copper-binding protein